MTEFRFIFPGKKYQLHSISQEYIRIYGTCNSEILISIVEVEWGGSGTLGTFFPEEN